MSQRSTKKPKVQLRRSPLALKIILTLLILFSIASLVALRWVHLDFQAEIGDLKSQAAEIEYENENLEKKTQNPGSVDTIKQIAQDELGLVDPNTVVLQPGTTDETVPQESQRDESMPTDVGQSEP